MAEQDPIHVAALDVVTSLSESNLRGGSTYSCSVPRALIVRLRDALEERYPGVVDRVYQLEKENDA